MKKIWKKIQALALVFFLVFTCMPMNSQAADAVASGGISVNVRSNGSSASISADCSTGVLYFSTEDATFTAASTKTKMTAVSGKGVVEYNGEEVTGYTVTQPAQALYRFAYSSATNEGDTLRIYGTFTDGTNQITFADTTFQYMGKSENNKGYWEVYVPEREYKELGLGDWNAPVGELTASSGPHTLEDTSITSLDGVAFNVIVKTSGQVVFYIGDTDSGWGGIVVNIDNNYDGIFISSAVPNYTTASQTISTDTIRTALGDTAFTLNNNEFKLRLTFDIDESDNLKLGVYINDTYIQTIEFTNGLGQALGTLLYIYKVSGDLYLEDVGEAVDRGTESGGLTVDYRAAGGTTAGDCSTGVLYFKTEDATYTVAAGTKMAAVSGEGAIEFNGMEVTDYTLTQSTTSVYRLAYSSATTVGDTLRVYGTFTDGTNQITFADTTFQYMGKSENDKGYWKRIYTEYTLADFGIGKGVKETDVYGTKEGFSSWNGTSLTGEVRFGTSWLLVGKYGDTSWQGIQFLYRDNGLYVGCALEDATGTEYNFNRSSNSISDEEAGVNFQTDWVKLRLTFDYTDSGIDMGVYVNDTFIKTISITTDKAGKGNNVKDCIGTYVMTTRRFEVFDEASEELSTDVYCNADLEGYTISDAQTVTIDDETYKKGDIYAVSGVHTLTYTLFGNTYSRKLVIYRRGDLNDDGKVGLRDLLRMKKQLSEAVEITLTESALKGADMDSSASVDKVDVSLLRDYLVLEDGVLLLSPYEGSTAAFPNEIIEAVTTNYYETNTVAYANGTDLYFREPVRFCWYDTEENATYTVYLATKEDFSDARTFEVTGNTLSVENLVPKTTYYWKVAAGDIVTKTSSFRTADTVRTLTIEGVSNTRDAGGYVGLDGKMVKYGMVYRGGRLQNITTNGINEMVNVLGVKTDLDLRTPEEVGTLEEVDGKKVGPLGSSVQFLNYSAPQYWDEMTSDTFAEALANEIRAFADEDNYPIYVHCTRGRDRTGTLILLINGLLGVSHDDLAMDYELTFLSEIGGTSNVVGPYQMGNFDTMYNNIQNCAPEGTFAEACEAFMKEYCGIAQEEIDSIRSILLEE